MPNTRNSKKYSNRSVPFNTDAENYVLGSILIDNKVIEGLIGKLVNTDFYDEKNQYIFQAMLNLRNSKTKIDVISVIEELKRLNYNDAENISNYLIEIIDEVPSTASVGLYVDIVEEKAIERQLIHSMQGLTDDILNSKYELNEILDRTEDQIMQIVKLRRTSEFITLAKAAEDTLKRINEFTNNKNDLTGLDTGYKGLNKATLGLQNGELIILAARPAVGKSAYAMNLALQAAKINKAHVAFFSLEMSVEQLLMRVYAYQSHIELSKIKSGKLSADELMLLKIAEEELKGINLYFSTNTATNIGDIRTKCRALKQEGKLDLVIIDYLQLINSTSQKGNRQEEVREISRELKTLTIELNIPIIALSQLRRESADREDKTPQLSDLRESGSIEQDADMVMFIYKRSDVEAQDEADELNEKVNELNNASGNKKQIKNSATELIVSIAKNRQGPLTDFDYHFYGNTCRFVEQEVFREIVRKKKKGGMRRLNANNINK